MKSHRQELWFNTKQRRGYLNITPDVESALDTSGIQEGFCLVNAMHITASVVSLTHDLSRPRQVETQGGQDAPTQAIQENRIV